LVAGRSSLRRILAARLLRVCLDGFVKGIAPIERLDVPARRALLATLAVILFLNASLKSPSSFVPVYSHPMQSSHPFSVDAAVREESSWAMSAIGVFLFFGAVMASLAGTTLIWRGTFLDHMWVLNALAYNSSHL
jgi:hypothetical protein